MTYVSYTIVIIDINGRGALRLIDKWSSMFRAQELALLSAFLGAVAGLAAGGGAFSSTTISRIAPAREQQAT
jgi:hypothetical protein